jgi:hypothetical protein
MTIRNIEIRNNAPVSFGMVYGLIWFKESARIFSKKEDTDGFLLRITLDKDKLLRCGS